MIANGRAPIATEAEVRRLRTLLFAAVRELEQARLNLALVSESRDGFMRQTLDLYRQLREVESRWEAAEVRARLRS